MKGYTAPRSQKVKKGSRTGQATSVASMYREGFLGDKLNALPVEPEVQEAGKAFAATMPGLLEELATKEEFGPPMAVPALNGDIYKKRRQLELLKQYRNRELRRLCLEDESGFWIFLYEILYSRPDQRQHYVSTFHGELAWQLQNLKAGENLLLCLPREHRKTNLILAYLCWCIVRDPDIRIKLISNKLQRAKDLSRMLREMFLINSEKFPRFKEVFPDFMITSREEILQAQQFTHPLRKAAYLDPTVYATFLGSTGSGGRCDILVIDDGWDNSTLTSPDQGMKVFQQLIDLLPLVEGSSIGAYRNIIITTTPWRYYDPTAIILGVSSEPTTGQTEQALQLLPFKTIVRHAMEDPTRLCDVCPPSVVERYPHGAPDWVNGEPILAPIFTSKALKERYALYCIKPELGEQSFWLQYMCIYRSQGQDKFQEEWFIQLDRAGWGAPKRRVLVLDDASKDFQQVGRGDYSVAKFGEFDDEGRLIKRYALRSNKWTRDQFISEILAWCQASNWWPQFTVKEKVGVDSFLTDLQRAFNSHGRPVVPVPAQRAGLGRKLDYIAGTLQGPYERREILFGNQYPQALFERDKYELLNLGSTAHDDMADADCLFFVEGVRVARGPELSVGPRAGEWVPPMDLGLFNPKSSPGGTMPIDYSSPGPSSILEQVAGRNHIKSAFEALGWDPEEVTFTPNEGGIVGGFAPDAGGDSDWWKGD